MFVIPWPPSLVLSPLRKTGKGTNIGSLGWRYGDRRRRGGGGDEKKNIYFFSLSSPSPSFPLTRPNVSAFLQFIMAISTWRLCEQKHSRTLQNACSGGIQQVKKVFLLAWGSMISGTVRERHSHSSVFVINN